METFISVILIILLVLIVLGLFSPSRKSRNEEIDKLLRVRDNMNYWYTCMEGYMNVIEKYQKDIDKLEKTLKTINAHFVMSNDEIEKHFPAAHNKVHLKPKLTLVKIKKQQNKLTKKEKKNEKPKK
jgi:predicted PurR-regulated permease PerM|tara:strand:- start:910 stop:1287 length:378 start_codon:yes stop_codon:yes gene_type:complete